MDYPPLSLEELEKIRDLRNTQPGFSRLLGTYVESITGDGQAVVRLPLGDSILCNASGTTIHGGVLFSLADMAGGCATWATGYHSATAGADIHFIAPALDAKELTARAKAIKFGKRLCVYDVEVTDETNRLLCKGTFTFVTLNRRIL